MLDERRLVQVDGRLRMMGVPRHEPSDEQLVVGLLAGAKLSELPELLAALPLHASVPTLLVRPGVSSPASLSEQPELARRAPRASVPEPV